MRTPSPAEQKTPRVKRALTQAALTAHTVAVSAGTHPLLKHQTVCFSGFAHDEDDQKNDARLGAAASTVGAASVRDSLASSVAIATQLGATVHPHLKRSTDWLVAAQGLSAKRVVAEKIGIAVVAPEWLCDVLAVAQQATGCPSSSEGFSREEEQEEDGERSTRAVLERTRVRFPVPCLRGYRFSWSHLGADEAETLHTLLSGHGAVLSASLSSACDALLLSREDTDTLRRAIRRLPAEVPADQSVMNASIGSHAQQRDLVDMTTPASSSSSGPVRSSTAAEMKTGRTAHGRRKKARTTLRVTAGRDDDGNETEAAAAVAATITRSTSEHLTSPLAPFLGSPFTAKLLFAWRHDIPVISYDHLLRSVAGLDDKAESEHRKAERRARWSDQVSLETLLESCRLHAPPPVWLRHDAADGTRAACAGDEDEDDADALQTGIGRGFVSRPFLPASRRRGEGNARAESPVSVAETVSARSLSLSSSAASSSSRSSSVVLESRADAVEHALSVNDESAEDGGDNAKANRDSLAPGHLSFVEVSRASGAVTESCTSDALVTQPDYLSLPHTHGAGAALGDRVEAYYALQRNAHDDTAPRIQVQLRPNPTGHEADDEANGRAGGNSGVGRHDQLVSSVNQRMRGVNGSRAPDDDEEVAEDGCAYGGLKHALGDAGSRPSLWWWWLTPRNGTAHLHVCLVGCTVDEYRLAVTACVVCRFFRSPIPTAQTDLVVIGSRLLKKKKFVDKLARAPSTERGPNKKKGTGSTVTTLRQHAQHQNNTAKTPLGKASGSGAVRVFYECAPAVLDELEVLYGLSARRVVPLAWLRACHATVQQKYRASREQAEAAAEAEARGAAHIETAPPYATQEENAEETVRWPSTLLGAPPGGSLTTRADETTRCASTKDEEQPSPAEGEKNGEEPLTEHVFSSLPPLSLEELPNPRDRQFRIHRRAERFGALYAPPAGLPTAQPPSARVEVAADGTSTSLQATHTAQSGQSEPVRQVSAASHTAAAATAESCTSTSAVVTAQAQYQRDRERAARVLRSLMDVLVSSDAAPDTAHAARSPQDWKQARLVDAHALRGLCVCLVDGVFDRAELAVARGLINMGGGQWVKKSAAQWRQALAKKTTSTATTTKAAVSAEEAHESDDNVVARVRVHAVYGKRAAKWWGRKNVLHVPSKADNVTEALTTATSLHGAETASLAHAQTLSDTQAPTQSPSQHPKSHSDENTSSLMVSKRVAQLQRLSSTCIDSPVVHLIPHSHQRVRDAPTAMEDIDTDTTIDSSRKHSGQDGDEQSLRFLVSVTSDYLLACMACGTMLNPHACFLFHKPIPSAPDMALLQHTTRQATRQGGLAASGGGGMGARTGNAARGDASASPFSRDTGDSRPPALSPWVWERRYAKAGAVGVSVSVVWRMAHEHLVDTLTHGDARANSEESNGGGHNDPATANGGARVPDAETATLMRVLLIGLHHIITALGGTLTEVFDPSAVTHVLLVDVDAIRDSRWSDLYDASSRSGAPTSRPSASPSTPPSSASSCYWPPDGMHAMAACVEKRRGGADDLCPVTLDWLEVSAQWGVFVHEKTRPAFQWTLPACVDANLEVRAAPMCEEADKLTTLITPVRERSYTANTSVVSGDSPVRVRASMRQKQQLIAQQLAQVRAGASVRRGDVSVDRACQSPTTMRQRTQDRLTPSEHVTPPHRPLFARAVNDSADGDTASTHTQSRLALPEGHSRQSCCTPPRPSPPPSRHRLPSSDSVISPTQLRQVTPSVSPSRVQQRHGIADCRIPSPSLGATPTQPRRSASRSRTHASQTHNTESLTTQQDKDRYLEQLSDRFRFHTPRPTPRRTNGPSKQSSPSPALQRISLTPRRASLRERSAAMAATPIAALSPPEDAEGEMQINAAGSVTADVTMSEGVTENGSHGPCLDKTEDRKDVEERVKDVKLGEKRQRGRSVAGDVHREHLQGPEPTPRDVARGDAPDDSKKRRLSARALRFSPSPPLSSPVRKAGESPARVLAADSFVGVSPLAARGSRGNEARTEGTANACVSHGQHSSEERSSPQRRTLAEALLLLAGDDESERVTRQTTATPAAEDSAVQSTSASSGRVTRSTIDLVEGEGTSPVPGYAPRLAPSTSRGVTPVIEVPSDESNEDEQEKGLPSKPLPAQAVGTSPGHIALARRPTISPLPATHAQHGSAVKATAEVSKKNDTDELPRTTPRGVVVWRPLRLYILHDVPNRAALLSRCEQLCQQRQRGLEQRSDHRRNVPHGAKRARSATVAEDDDGDASAAAAAVEPIRFVSRCEEADVVVTHELTARETVLAAVAAGLWLVRVTVLDEIIERLGRGFGHFQVAAMPCEMTVAPTTAEARHDTRKVVAAANAANLHWLEAHEWGPEFLSREAPPLHTQLARQCRLRRREAQRAAQAASAEVTSRVGLFAGARALLFVAPTASHDASAAALTAAPSPTGNAKATTPRKSSQLARHDQQTPVSASTSSRSPKPRSADVATSCVSQEDKRRVEKRLTAVRRLISAGGGTVREVIVMHDASTREKRSEPAHDGSLDSSAADAPPAVCFPASVTSTSPSQRPSPISSERLLADAIVKACVCDQDGCPPERRDETMQPEKSLDVLLLIDTPLLEALLTGVSVGTTDAAVSMVSWLNDALTAPHSTLRDAIRHTTRAYGKTATQPVSPRRVRVSLRSFSWLARCIAGDATADTKDGGTFCSVDLSF